jgi:hypothetical protein
MKFQSKLFAVSRGLVVRLQELYQAKGKRTNKRNLKYKKCTVEKSIDSIRRSLITLALEHRGEAKYCHVYAEELAAYHEIPAHIVKQCFQKLNLEGLISQAENRVSMNCGRCNTYTEYSGWRASMYYINVEKCKSLT